MSTRTVPETQWCMLTVVGGDRPGIVASLTEALYRGGCNLGEASMVRLGGNFAVMLMVEGAECTTLEGLLRPVTDALDLRLHVDPIAASLHHHQEPNVQVTVYGADRPGIVAQVTGMLAEAECNILDLNSDVAGSSDQPIYVMIIDGNAPGGVADLEHRFEVLRRDGVEVRISAIETLIG
jgi:glycine cleavage system transcriptional repressor